MKARISNAELKQVLRLLDALTRAGVVDHAAWIDRQRKALNSSK